MNQTITIDSRRCGAGKTTSILENITQHLENNGHVLVVVPSIHLQYEYANRAPHIKWTIINNTNTIDSTVLAAQNALRETHKAIIITHATYTLIPYFPNKSRYYLVIDEALENVVEVIDASTEPRQGWNPQLHINGLWRLSTKYANQLHQLAPHDTVEWHKLERINAAHKTIISDSSNWKKLTNPNYDIWATLNAWTKLLHQLGDARVISTLKPEILHNWKKIHIAAAAFKHTMMYHWMCSNKIASVEVEEFIRHSGDYYLHAPNGIKLSMRMLKEQPNVISQYHQYIRSATTDPILCVRNNQSNANIGSNEKRITHNVHGQNDYRNYNHVNIETALQPDPHLLKFLQENWFNQYSNKYEMNRAIITAYRGYRFYQVVLRGSIRNATDTPYNVYVLDEETAISLNEFIEFKDPIPIPIAITKKVTGRPRKYATPEEAVEARKEKQKLLMRQRRSAIPVSKNHY